MISVGQVLRKAVWGYNQAAYLFINKFVYIALALSC